jgi:hypothetical protein
MSHDYSTKWKIIPWKHPDMMNIIGTRPNSPYMITVLRLKNYTRTNINFEKCIYLRLSAKSYFTRVMRNFSLGWNLPPRANCWQLLEGSADTQRAWIRLVQQEAYLISSRYSRSWLFNTIQFLWYGFNFSYRRCNYLKFAVLYNVDV